MKKANKIYRERRDALTQLLNQSVPDKISFAPSDGGFGTWVQYAGGIHSKTVAAKAASLGLWINNSSIYYHNKQQAPYNAVRLGFASLNLTEIEQAVTLFARALKKI